MFGAMSSRITFLEVSENERERKESFENLVEERKLIWRNNG